MLPLPKAGATCAQGWRLWAGRKPQMTTTARSRRYRQRAKEIRIRADRTEEPRRQELLAIADAYLKLAEEWERAITAADSIAYRR
jgi:hypothetical protein